MTRPAAVPAHRNPFRVERQHALRFRFPPGDDIDALLDRLRTAGGRGAIVGPHGSGKTTLLEELATRLRADGWNVRALRTGREDRALAGPARRLLDPPPGPADAIVFDGAGHLLPWSWWAFHARARPAGVVLVTAHRAGRLPTVLRTSTSPSLLAELCDRLGVPLRDARADALWRAHRGDVRAALRELYDLQSAPGADPHAGPASR